MDLICEERLSDSPYIELIWRSYNEQSTPFISIAQPHWGMVITKHDGKTSLTVRGPETKPTLAHSPSNAEFIGIHFKLGTLLPIFPAKAIMDRADVTLPQATSQTFWLDSRTWQFPDYENIDTFVDWLVRDGLLLHDPIVTDMLEGKPVSSSLRTAQRRFLQATGLTHGTIAQIKRARYATSLLKQGISTLDAVHAANYSDQAHLIRSLKRFIGRTPHQIASENRAEALSFLFNT